MKICDTAVIHPKAEISDGVEIGQFSYIGEHVRIGKNTRIYPNVVIDGWTTIGENNKIFPGVVIGMDPQDLRYNGEPTKVVIGDDNIIREHVTIHRATHGGTTSGDGAKAVTIVGNRNYLMAHCHVAHNCKIWNEVVICNSVELAGYVEVEDGATLGGIIGVHQFTRIGKWTMVGGFTRVVKDIPPFIKVEGQPARPFGLNNVGLKRRGVGAERRLELKRACRILYQDGNNLTQAIQKISTELTQTEEILYLLNFLEHPSRMGILI